jgi:phosphoadenosine phosphosulfate reductase
MDLVKNAARRQSPPLAFDRDELAAKSKAFAASPPQDVLAYVLDQYSPDVAISTAFGLEGCAVIHMAIQIDPRVSVFTIDTGYLFRETQRLRYEFVDKYGIDLTVFESKLTVAQQERKHGLKLFESDSERCCALRKVEPNQRALAGLDCWIAGLRRDQGPSRADIGILELAHREDGAPIVKANPLATWKRDDTWRYIMDNGVPYNELLDHGYKSVGCWPCTRPVAPGEDERAGRWNGEKNECGIHQRLPDYSI